MASTNPKTSSSEQGSPSSSNLTTIPNASATTSIAAHLSSLNVNPNNPENKFPLFPKMPLELRRKCFHDMFPGPRIIEVLFAKSSRSDKYDFLADTPVVLHICKESRKEALAIYILAFGGKNALNPVYFSPEIDTLYLRELGHPSRKKVRMFLQHVPGKEIIQKLALSTECFVTTQYHMDNNIRPGTELPSLHGLRELTFITAMDTDISENARVTNYHIAVHHRNCRACGATPKNHTVFLSEGDFVEHGRKGNNEGLIYDECYWLECVIEKQRGDTEKGMKCVSSGWLLGPKVWLFGEPKVRFGGALIHKIEHEQWYAKLHGRKVHETRQKSLMASRGLVQRGV
ncbi:hypothetical protein DL98DRAFT_174666 [Cadophora sp. DSE1049]|nr:hypothetical protein DL98DRAFT_174666 [Cadophora sp. DSE1049]